MEDNIRKMLEKKEQPENVVELMNLLRGRLTRSRARMSKNYPRWRRNLKVYNGEMPADASDVEATEVDEPERFVVPLTFAQVQTFVSFAFLLLMQNKYFYEFDEVGDEDQGLRDVMETVLHGEMQQNRWASKLYQSLLDAGRMGMMVTKGSWQRQTVWVPRQYVVQDINGSMFEMPEDGDIEMVKFEGNNISILSPFKWYPDPDLPLARWEEGTWVADEEEYKFRYVEKLERDGILAGVEHLERMTPEMWDKRRDHNVFEMLEREQVKGASQGEEKDFVVILGEHYVRLKPADYGLGPEKYDKLYLIRTANDQRIVSIEPYGYLHDEFPHNVGFLSPDTCNDLAASLCDTIHAIQEVVSYLINSRVLSLRKNLGRNLIVDSSVIDIEGLQNGNDIITTKQGAPRNGIERYVKQLDFRDNTMSNLGEADQLQRLLMVVTGVNENAMGQFSPGRRSATENRAANSGAASRMKMIVTLLWTNCYAPQGVKQICNLRYGLSREMFEKYVGQMPNLEEMYEKFAPSDLSKLVGSRDLFMMDNTTSSEKGFLAQSLQELLVQLMSNPQTAPLYDTNKLLEEIYALRGVKMRRFRLAPIAAPPVLPGVGPAPAVAPGGPAPVV